MLVEVAMTERRNARAIRRNSEKSEASTSCRALHCRRGPLGRSPNCGFSSFIRKIGPHGLRLTPSMMKKAAYSFPTLKKRSNRNGACDVGFGVM